MAALARVLPRSRIASGIPVNIPTSPPFPPPLHLHSVLVLYLLGIFFSYLLSNTGSPQSRVTSCAIWVLGRFHLFFFSLFSICLDVYALIFRKLTPRCCILTTLLHVILFSWLPAVAMSGASTRNTDWRKKKDCCDVWLQK